MSTSRSSNTPSLAPTSATTSSHNPSKGPWKKHPTSISVGNPYNNIAIATRALPPSRNNRSLVAVPPHPIPRTHGPSSGVSTTASGSGAGVASSGVAAKRRKVEKQPEGGSLNLQPIDIPLNNDKKGKTKAVPRDEIIDVDADIDTVESPSLMEVDRSSPDELRLKQGDALPDGETLESACTRKSKFFSLADDRPSSQEVEYVGRSAPARRALLPVPPNPVEVPNRVRKAVDVYERLSDGNAPKHIDLSTKVKKKQAMRGAKFTPNLGIVDSLSAPSTFVKPASKPQSRTSNNGRQPLDMQPVVTAKRRKGTPKPKVTNRIVINDAMYCMRTGKEIPPATSLSWGPGTTLTLHEDITGWQYEFDTNSCESIQVSTKDCARKVMDFVFKRIPNAPFKQVLLLIESGQSEEEFAHFHDFTKGKGVAYLGATASETVIRQGLRDFGDDDEDGPGPSTVSKHTSPPRAKEGIKQLLALRNAPPNPKKKRRFSQVEPEIIVNPHAQDTPSANGARQTTVAESTSATLRRSTRSIARREEPSSPSSTNGAAVNNRPRPPKADPDEIILNYPSGVPGSVNITNADLARLEPGEFLNDTVIEFALKLWLRELERDNPELASQVHVFNSFFYKKLNVKKEVGYESVKKWTSKFDIFKKKYIIVPINENFHWYLAIIYEPEHMLSPPLPSDSQPTRQTRQTPQKPQSSRTDPPPTTTISIPKTPPPPDGPSDMILTTPNSEAEVERDLADFPNSCSLTDPIEPDEAPMKDDDHDSDGGLSYMSEPRPRSLSASEMRREPELTPRGPSSSSSTKKASDPEPEVVPDSEAEDEVMIVDTPSPKPDSVSRSTTATATGTNDRSTSPEIVEGPSGTKSEGGVPVTRFYGSASVKSRMKGKAKAKPQSSNPVLGLVGEPVEVHSTTDSGDEEPVANAIPQTYIFTLDSLGSRHPQAVKKLSKYLQLEALDKKGITVTKEAKGKFPAVPSQPNFCDCGIYVLHFVETFIKNPQGLAELMITKSPRLQAKPDHQQMWNHEAVGHKRADLSARVLELSALWKEERRKAAETEAPSKVEDEPEDSDDEVLVIHASPPPPVGKKGPANRLR